jgi:hypothetical protein
VAHPCILVVVRRFLQRRHGSFIGIDGRQTNNNQNLTKGGFYKGVSILRPYLGLGGGGGRIQSSAERKGQECNYLVFVSVTENKIQVISSD